MTALLPGSSSVGALPPGRAGGAMVAGGAKKGMSKEPIWSSGTTSGGEYLSVADRKAIFRKQKINAAKFVGRSSSVVGGAMMASGRGALVVGSSIVPRVGGLQAPEGADAEPQTSKIGSRVKALEELVAQISESVKSNAKKITLLKNVVKSHIQRFADFLKNDSEEKRKQLLEQQKAEAKALEEGQRDAAEEALEAPNKIKNTLLKPVQMVGKKVGGILQKLKDAFLVIGAGWLTNRGFDAIQAFMDGDKEKLKEIRNNVLGALGVVGGIFLVLSGGLLALPAIIASVVGVIASVGGAILGFLLSPPGLITLAIAAGVGTLLLGVKKLWNWIDDKATGGDNFLDKHKELDQRLRDAGMSPGTGFSKNRSKQEIRKRLHGRSPEQEKIWQEVEEMRDKLHELKNIMNAEIKDVPNTIPKTGTRIKGGGKGKNYLRRGKKREIEKYHTEEDKKKIEQRQDLIRKRYNNLIEGIVGKITTMSNIPPSEGNATINGKDINPEFEKVNKSNIISGLGDVDPNIIVKKVSANTKGAPQGSSASPTRVPSIASADPDNFYVMYSKMNYNVVT